MGKIFTVIIATVAKRKNASLGNSMLNHPGHVTFTLRIFLKFLPMVVIIETNSKNISLQLQHFRSYVIFKKWQIDHREKSQSNTTFSYITFA